MSQLYDCVIVGAGPAGGSAAYHLAKRGRSV
ncbi:MAG: NAD(P)-binding protein, partial [Cyanobacteriota bacterium]